jgi:hypothetical protein
VENIPLPKIRRFMLEYYYWTAGLGQYSNATRGTKRHMPEEFGRLFINVLILDEDAVECSGVEDKQVTLLERSKVEVSVGRIR